MDDTGLQTGPPVTTRPGHVAVPLLSYLDATGPDAAQPKLAVLIRMVEDR